MPEVPELVRAFQTAGVRAWLIGGNAAELVTGLDLRPHDDIDFFVSLADARRAVQTVQSLGFAWAHGRLEAGDVFYRRHDLLLDLVPLDDRVDPPRAVGELAGLALPTGFLTPYTVRHGELSIPTLTPAMQIQMKRVVAGFYGVEPREKDLVDLQALRATPPSVPRP